MNLATDKKVPGSPRRVKLQVNTPQAFQVDLDRSASASAGSAFGKRNWTDGQFIFPAADSAPGAGLVFRMRLIKPRNQDGSVHQNHGRVRFSSSTPESLPSQVPARLRICFCMALALVLSGRATSALFTNRQVRTVPSLMPACLRSLPGIVVWPLLVTRVSLFTPKSYFFRYYFAMAACADPTPAKSAFP